MKREKSDLSSPDKIRIENSCYMFHHRIFLHLFDGKYRMVIATLNFSFLENFIPVKKIKLCRNNRLSLQTASFAPQDFPEYLNTKWDEKNHEEITGRLFCEFQSEFQSIKLCFRGH